MRKLARIRLHVSLLLLTLLSLGLAGGARPPTVAAADRPVIYLTFDDGPSVPYTGQVLTLLTRYHAQATFLSSASTRAPIPACCRPSCARAPRSATIPSIIARWPA